MLKSFMNFCCGPIYGFKKKKKREELYFPGYSDAFDLKQREYVLYDKDNKAHFHLTSPFHAPKVVVII